MAANSTKKSASKTKKATTKKVLPTEAEVTKTSLPKTISPTFTLLLAVLIVGGLLFLMRSYFVAAVVNGRPISRFNVVRELEKAQGKQMLETLIVEELIRQEARDKNVVVTQEELDTKIGSIETEVSSSGQNIDDLLAAQGLTRDDFIEQVRLQLLLEKMVQGQSAVSEDDINAYIEQNEAFFPEDLTDEEKREMALSQIDQQQTSQAIQDTVARLQSEANVQYWVSY